MLRVLGYHQKQDSAKGRRGVALLSLLTMGFRRGKIAGLDVKDVDLGRGEFSVLRERRSKSERLELSGEVEKALSDWLEVHEGFEPLLYSFSNRSFGSRMAVNSIWQAVKNLGDECGVKLWPRGMRRSALT